MFKCISTLLLLVLVACQSSEPKTEMEATIHDYIKQQNLKNVQQTARGVYVAITEKKDGIKPELSSHLVVNYTGKLLDGTIFDSSFEPLEFYLGNALVGWQDGLQEFGQGDKGVLIIPPSLGFGDKQLENVPPNSVLVYEIELLDVGNH